MNNPDYLLLHYKLIENNFIFTYSSTDLPNNLILECTEWFNLNEGHYYFNINHISKDEALTYVKTRYENEATSQIHLIYDKITKMITSE